MLRRHLLVSTALVPVVLAMEGCNGATPQQVAQQAVADVKLIASGLAGALPSLGAAVGISPATVATVGGIVSRIQSVADGVGQAASNLDAQPLIRQLEQLLNAAVAALAGLALPPPFGPALTAATVLLPVIESLVGLALPATAAAVMPSQAQINDARLVLAGAAQGK